MKFKLRRYYLYYLGRLCAFAFYMIPLRAGLVIADAIGLVAYHALAKYRRITVDNLSSVFGSEKNREEIERIARKSFQNLARNALEMVNFPKINKSNIDKIVTMINSSALDRAFERGKGIIIITAHIGNWELMAATLRLKGYPGVTVGRRIYFHKYDEYLNHIRRLHDVHVIYRDESPRKILKHLRNNEIVGIVADQDMDSVDGVFVNFFGRPAYTPIGPAALAKLSGASLLPVYILRENGRHKLVVEEPVEIADTGNGDADILTNTQRWSNVIEACVRRYPDQWVWMHRRWKTKRRQN